MSSSIRVNTSSRDGGWKALLSSIALPSLALLCSLVIAAITEQFGLVILEALIGLALFTIVLVLRLDEVATTLVLLLQIYLDWYVGYRIFSLGLAVFLLFFFFLARSEKRPWTEPRQLWAWLLLLAVTIFPAIRGATNNHDFLLYYPDIILGALIMFWLGTVMARDAARLRSLFQAVTCFGTLMALHTIYQEFTGKILFALARVEAYNSGQADFQLGVDLNVHRAQSFLIDPNWNGTFLVLMLFLAIGLFVEARSIRAKLLYISEILIIMPALLFTYSASAWGAVIVGMAAFVVFVGNTRFRIMMLLFIALVALVMLIGFSAQVNLLFLHATDPAEIRLRNAVWQTAYRVIHAYPLTGVGLGHQAYLKAAEHFRVPDQVVSLDHPHNSYLELTAMGGIPVLLTFLLVVLAAWWQTLRNWLVVDVRVRALLAAGLASTLALSFNSWGNQGWTLPPLAGLAWLILGATSSPLLIKNLSAHTEQTYCIQEI